MRSSLCTLNLRGGVELFDAGTRRHIYQGRFEFTYVSPSQVIVKRLSTGRRIVLKSHLGYEVQRINIYSDSKPSEEGPAPQRPDQYIVAQTPATLLLGDLESCKLSEIEWAVTGSEKFYFDNPAVCMIYNAGELCLLDPADQVAAEAVCPDLNCNANLAGDNPSCTAFHLEKVAEDDTEVTLEDYLGTYCGTYAVPCMGYPSVDECVEAMLVAHFTGCSVTDRDALAECDAWVATIDCAETSWNPACDEFITCD